MARKTSAVHRKPNNPIVPSIKFVKKANMYCKTWFEGDSQKQAWSVEKPQ